VRPSEVLLVVYRPGPQFLVLLRSPERHGYWNLAAGGVEDGESPEEAALRELDEETGLQRPIAFSAVPLELGYRRPEGTWIPMHAFAAEAPAGWEPTLDEEHVAHRWCSRAEALELLAFPEPRAAVEEVARARERRA
jgi:8-oxo-dGTP pyrophosphatase MutT (NUDIX family)